MIRLIRGQIGDRFVDCIIDDSIVNDGTVKEGIVNHGTC